MHVKKLNQAGFHLVALLLIIVLVGAIASVGYWVLSRNSTANAEVQWAFDENKLEWFAKTGTPPHCREPLAFDRSPIDTSQVSAVLLPGSYRGRDYKPHGGFGTPEALGGKVDVKMPADATLVGLTRYYEGDPPDLQYLLTFETDCGIAFRFDHLHTLSPELQAIADKTPEPKLNDTRTSPDDNPPPTKFKSGQVIATQVGLPSMKIYGFDFGVYDYRQRNEISKNSAWAQLHDEYESLEWFGVCWYDMLPDISGDKLRELSLAQTDTRREVKKVSDYCTHTPYKTLDVDGGQPTDG